jgi:hypothetical protein
MSMPTISRPLLAANDDGLWLTPSLASGFTGKPAIGLYRVAPGARRPVLAAHTGGLAHWLVASRHSVWIDVARPSRPSRLIRFDGADANAVFDRTTVRALDYMQAGYIGVQYAADSLALWAVVPGRGQQVIRIDPATGASMPVAAVHPDTAYAIQIQPPIVSVHGEAFFLDPPAQSSSFPRQHEGFSALYRVAP